MAPLGAGKNMDYYEYRGRVHENNAIADLTRDPRYIMVWRSVNNIEPMSGVVARAGEEKKGLSAAEFDAQESRYGLARYATEWTDEPLWGFTRRRH